MEKAIACPPSLFRPHPWKTTEAELMIGNSVALRYGGFVALLSFSSLLPCIADCSRMCPPPKVIDAAKGVSKGAIVSGA